MPNPGGRSVIRVIGSGPHGLTRSPRERSTGRPLHAQPGPPVARPAAGGQFISPKPNSDVERRSQTPTCAATAVPAAHAPLTAAETACGQT